MIKLNKPQDGPTFPYKKGKHKGECRLIIKTNGLKEEYVNHQVNFDNGSREFTFDGSLWGNETVKKILKVEVQSNRCCYCEKDITDGGSLEHFRPKKGVKQKAGNSIEKPGYYWLAYEWSNWFYSCQECNNAKDTIFPITDDKKRAKNHLVDEKCIHETPILPDLTKDDPSEIIEYKGVEVFPKKGNNQKGKTLIETVKLDRSTLLDTRAEHCEIHWRMKESLELGLLGYGALKFYNTSLQESSKPGKKFSYMMKCNLESWKIGKGRFFWYWLLSIVRRIVSNKP